MMARQTLIHQVTRIILIDATFGEHPRSRSSWNSIKPIDNGEIPGAVDETVKEALEVVVRGCFVRPKEEIVPIELLHMELRPSPKLKSID
jgi:hypothetical protein